MIFNWQGQQWLRAQQTISISSIRLFLEEVNQHRQSLADALDKPVEAIDAYLDILRNEIFVEE